MLVWSLPSLTSAWCVAGSPASTTRRPWLSIAHQVGGHRPKHWSSALGGLVGASRQLEESCEKRSTAQCRNWAAHCCTWVTAGRHLFTSHTPCSWPTTLPWWFGAFASAPGDQCGSWSGPGGCEARAAGRPCVLAAQWRSCSSSKF